MKHRTKVWCS